MANAAYNLWKQLIGQAGIGEAALDLTAATFKVAMIDTADYTFSQSHDFFNDASAGSVGTPQAIPTPAFTGSVLDGGDVTFSALTGDSVEALLLYVDTGSAATSPLILYLDTGVAGLPFTPSGGDVVIQWDNGANKIYNLGGG